MSTKISVSLSSEDVEFLDDYAASTGTGSRSRAVREAVRLLRAATLGDDYAAAWDEWSEEHAEAWESAVGDGLG